MQLERYRLPSAFGSALRATLERAAIVAAATKFLPNAQKPVICICMSLDVSRSLLSRRERNREATRRAIAEAALHLATRHGLDAVRNEDIARSAGVSLRTFSNYFTSKYEALSFRHAERMRFAAAALRNRPADESLWTAIHAAVLAPWIETVTDGPLSLGAIAELRLLFGNRQVQAEIMTDAVAVENEFAMAVAERLGLDSTRDIYPRLVAAAATAVTQVAIDAFLRAEPPVAQLPLISEALTQLARGLPEPIVPADKANRCVIKNQ